jgi:Protein of unknown function (DUF2950)
MRSGSLIGNLHRHAWAMSVIALTALSTPVVLAAQQLAASKTSSASAAPAGAAAASAAATDAKLFSTPQEAADALVKAADTFDETALVEIFGPRGIDVAFTGEIPQDRKRAADFAAQAREKKSISTDPKNGTRAFLLVGNEDWPFPVPIIKSGSKWHFDSAAGRQELMYRRIGANELDAIHICDGFVEAQEQYAFEKPEGYQPNQYAQRIISTPGKHDGLSWQNPDGTWGGPVGENIAQAIAEGYGSKDSPYHGYYFKVLKGQGPAAPMGQLDYVIGGAMIGGFALVAAPAEYRVTGVNTFMVSQDGVVYQKDLGPMTLDIFKKMERFNPDKSWTPVEDDSD